MSRPSALTFGLVLTLRFLTDKLLRIRVEIIIIMGFEITNGFQLMQKREPRELNA